jgi:hypothetical protein
MAVTATSLDTHDSATFTDGSAELLYGRTVTDDGCGYMEIQIIARRVSDGATKTFDIVHGFKKNTGDNATVFGLSILNTSGTVGDLLALSGVSATVVVSGENTNLMVTGLAETVIDWVFNVFGVELVHT